MNSPQLKPQVALSDGIISFLFDQELNPARVFAHLTCMSFCKSNHTYFMTIFGYICDPFWENVPKRTDNIFPDLPIKT